MYAIVQTSGKQYRVAVGDTLLVDRIQAEVGDTVTLADVLLVAADEVKVGAPTVAGARVSAKVVDHRLGDKVITFKYTRTRRHRRRVGFRHSHTTLEILAIEA